MISLQNSIRSINDIIIRLASNSDLQRLLIVDDYDVKNADFQPLTIQDMLDKHYIELEPQTEAGIEKTGRNIFLNVQMQDIIVNEDHLTSQGIIYICYNLKQALISNYKDRGLEIADLIIRALHNLKISSSVAVKVNRVSRMAYTQFLVGYSISFSFEDQNEQEAEI